MIGLFYSYSSRMTPVRSTSPPPTRPLNRVFFASPGRLRPVEVSIPSLMDDEDEVSATPGAGIDLAMDIDDTFEESSVRKGKRKVVD